MIEKITAHRSEINWTKVTVYTAFVSLGILVPSIGMPQYITGPLVNALLIVAVETLGLWPAASLGAITPLAALAHGVLPLPMMIMIPFIAVANLLLVATYSCLRARPFWQALGVAASVKFLWLACSVTWFAVSILGTLSGGKMALPTAYVSMMTWPQLATAITGGVLAWTAMYGLRRWNRRSE